ncbi:MAG: hypothetical protein E7085_02635 [Parabacteroides distasonis]|nr:hypothetical protein [Parabacteroides distasonis]
MEELLALVKEQVLSSVAGKFNVPANEQSQINDGLADSVIEGLKQLTGNGSNIGELLSSLSGNNSSVTNQIAQAAIDYFGSNIATKLNLSPEIVNTAKSVLPIVVNQLVQQISSGKGLDFGTLLGSLSGGDTLKNMAGGLLGGLFK